MLRSLRRRLALLFAATLLVAATIAGFASIRLYQSYNRDQTRRGLKAQAAAVAAYYQQAFEDFYVPRHGQRSAPTPVSAEKLRQITGARIYYAGGAPQLFPQQRPSFTSAHIPINYFRLSRGDLTVFEWTPPGENRPFIGVVAPVISS